ncbi:helix-turn-helix transcriptional regulator [Trinickia fusca]|uniref:LuxR family transcriptional regulator n=1 Tax=Trinickia fusca TaxID=2419777 RepID=A0A494XD00_9BURK|nr:helix-turn-helix transcriptional regulator [Trinickia fusca]RKP47521.1 LuxR family transcriptional regulator [Trinickia fusca]
MSDLISSAFSSLIDQMPGACACKAVGSTFLYGNAEFKRSMGLGEELSLLGLRHSDLPAAFGSFDDSYVAQDRFVMEQGSTVRSINVYHASETGVKAYLVVKKPFVDCETNARGVLIHGTDITNINSSMLQLARLEPRLPKSLPRGSFVIRGETQGVDLTPRETEILFFLLRGGVARRIADLLSISVRTVEHHIDALKDKFAVSSKPELIEKAIEMGYFYITPATLFGVD